MKPKKHARSGTKRRGHQAGAAANIKVLRAHLVSLLKGGAAHVHFDDAISGFPPARRGAYVQGLPHTAWQLIEHVRIAQWDILEFSRNPRHVSPESSDEYWPKSPLPRDDAAWKKSVASFKKDLQAMIRLIENPRTDLFARIPRGQGKTILREAFVLADHNSYHLGQLIDLRRALGAWPEA